MGLYMSSVMYGLGVVQNFHANLLYSKIIE